MDQPTPQISAQVHFLDTELALIHIPLHLYNTFIQPILQLLLPSRSCESVELDQPNTGEEPVQTHRPWAYQHPFVNVSITPVECSVACSRAVANRLFTPVRNELGSPSKEQVTISKENYIVIQVDSPTTDAGQRVLELTSPLAMNGISIFFITTYFSDYILVPVRSRSAVISALEERGFVFEESSEGFVNLTSPLMHPSSPSLQDRNTSNRTIENPFETVSGNTDQLQAMPTTPPPSSATELESRTFNLLTRRNIRPQVDRSIEVLQCAGRKDTLRGGEHVAHSSSIILTMRLHLGLVRCLTSTPRPRFLSLTLTDTEPPSLFLERRLLVEFGDEGIGDDDSVLLGSKDDTLIPIVLDLREIPMESTGIVCGVAGRVVGRTSLQLSRDSTADIGKQTTRLSLDEQFIPPVEMSYLSTARAGAVMVPQSDLKRALDALEGVDSNSGIVTGLGIQETG